LTAKRRRVVIDTNVFVSGILRKDSVAAQAVRRALPHEIILRSGHATAELAEVLLRPKFNKAGTLADRRDLLAEYAAAFDPIEIVFTVTDCRDVRDNIFLELALSGQADIIVTGDADLLSLHPWRGIAILSRRIISRRTIETCVSIPILLPLSYEHRNPDRPCLHIARLR
jgi:putative PIN family toxin of toxin-antitoxin system